MKIHDGDPPLLEVVQAGRSKKLKRMLSEGEDVNTRSRRSGSSALHIAAIHGHGRIASMLLFYGADKEALDNAGETPLIRAAREGHPKVVEILLAAGADRNFRSVGQYDGAALHFAAGEGHSDVISVLLQMGADKDVLDGNGETPLIWAVIKGHLPVVEALLDFGADVNIPNALRGRYTPLHAAASLGQGDIVSALLARGADALVTDDGGLSPLVAAAHRGHYLVYLLMANGTALADGKADGCFALRHAFHSGHDGVVAALLQRADDDALDCDGERPLIWAAAGGYLPMVESLVAAGGNVNVRRRSDGCAALHLAAGGGYVGIVSALLRKGAYKDVLDNKGTTPLVWATAEGHQPTAEGLIEAGADCNTRSKDDGFSALHLAARKGYGGIVSALLGGRANVDAADHEGNTALMWAAGKGHDIVVEVLLAAGADVSIRNNIEASALDWASVDGHVAVQDAILRHLADANANDDGGTDVHLAARTDQADPTQVLIDAEFGFDDENTVLHPTTRVDQADATEVVIKEEFDFTDVHVAARIDQADATEVVLKEESELDDEDTDVHPSTCIDQADATEVMVEEEFEFDNGGADVNLAARTDQVDANQVLIEEGFDFDSRGKTKAIESGSLAEDGGGSFRGILGARAWLDVEGTCLALAIFLWFSCRCRLRI